MTMKMTKNLWDAAKAVLSSHLKEQKISNKQPKLTPKTTSGKEKKKKQQQK